MKHIKIIVQIAWLSGVMVAILGCLMGAVYSIIVSGIFQQVLIDMLWLGGIGLGLGFVTGALICIDFIAKKRDFYAMAAVFATVLGAIELGIVLWCWA